jgi:Protein of unknown function (DUF998)
MTRRWWILGLSGEILFAVTWVAAGFWQGPGYRAARDDISDMGALTAPHAWAYLGPQAVAGLAVIGFALLGLRPALRQAGAAGRYGPWLAAASAVQDVTDAAFRLDCRVVDGCSPAQATASWHGSLHADIGLACVLALIGSPFVLARAFQRLPEWQSLAGPSRWTGLLVAAVLIGITLPSTDGAHGLLQRAATVIAAAWGIALALRLRALTNASRPRAGSRRWPRRPAGTPPASAPRS